MYGELGRMPLQTYRMYAIIKYWNKSMYASEYKYTMTYHTLLKSDADNRRSVINNGVLY